MKTGIEDYIPLNNYVLLKIPKRQSGKIQLSPEQEREAMGTLFMEVLAVSDSAREQGIGVGDGAYFFGDIRKEQLIPLKYLEEKGKEQVEYDVMQIPVHSLQGIKKRQYVKELV